MITFSDCTVGIPQGSSISLFLANAAAHNLDLELDRKNGVFCRFADDCVVLTYSYEDAIAATETFFRFSTQTDMKLNSGKSDGIRLVTSKLGEIKSAPSFSFLGYRFSKEKLSIGEKKLLNIKKSISKIVYNNLLLYPRKSLFSANRIGSGFTDWDLVTCINEVRRYIYAGHSQKTLEDYISGRVNIRKVRGLMAYYCLVDDHNQLHGLDGWLLSVVRRAYIERSKILGNLGLQIVSLSQDELLSGAWYSFPSRIMEIRMPSFYLAWRVAKLKYERYGIGGISIPRGAYAYIT